MARDDLINTIAQRMMQRRQQGGLTPPAGIPGGPVPGVSPPPGGLQGLPPGLQGRALPPGLARLQARRGGPFKPGGPFSGTPRPAPATPILGADAATGMPPQKRRGYA